MGVTIKSTVQGTHYSKASLTSSIAHLEHGVLAEPDRTVLPTLQVSSTEESHLRYTSRLDHTSNSPNNFLPKLHLYTHQHVCILHYPTRDHFTLVTLPKAPIIASKHIGLSNGIPYVRPAVTF